MTEPGAPVETFSDFASQVNIDWLQARMTTTLRYGQVFFSTLAKVHPLLAEDIRSTHRDPFHKRTVDAEIWDYCCKKWDTTARSI
jgi:hypothetical protein